MIQKEKVFLNIEFYWNVNRIVNEVFLPVNLEVGLDI